MAYGLPCRVVGHLAVYHSVHQTYNRKDRKEAMRMQDTKILQHSSTKSQNPNVLANQFQTLDLV